MDRLDERASKPASLRRRFLSPPTFVSFGLAAVLILFLATRFDLDWSATWDNIRGMNPWLYLLAIISYYISFGFRGLRWRMLALNALVDSSSEARIPSALKCAQLIVMGWFVNSIAWLRLGDAYRAYAFAEESRSRFSWSLGTVLAERVLDMAIVSLVLIASGIALTMTKGGTDSGYVVVAAAIMAVATVALILAMNGYGVRVARLLPRRFRLAYQQFQQGTLGSFKQLRLIVLLGLFGWIMEMARLYLVVQALDLSISPALVPVAALGHAILSSVPTPGGVGVVEPGLTGLLLISLERSDAASVVVVDRSITYLSVILVGGLVFLLRQISQARQRKQAVASGLE